MSMTRFHRWLPACIALFLLALAAGTRADIVLVGATSAGSANTTSQALNVPAGVAAGNILIAQIAVRGGSGTTITPPAGWTTILVNNSGTTIRQGIYYRIADGTEPASYSFGISPQQRTAAAMVAYSGVDGASPINASSTRTNASSTSVTANGVTTTVASAMLVGLFATSHASSFTPPGGMAEQADQNGGAGPNGVTVAISDEAQAVAGASGLRTATAADAAISIGSLLALKPATDLDHIRIEHSGSGVTCTASQLTIKACMDAACTSLYTGGASGNLVWAGAPGGSVAFATGATGQASINLSVLTPQTVTLGTSAVSPAPSGTSPQCYVGATANCSHVFADSGFLFSPIPAQTAGVTSGSLSIRAVRKSDNSAACTGLFSGNVAIDMASQCVNPTTCAGRQVTINATAIASNPASGIAGYTPVTLNFGANSTATFTLNYPDVGAMSLSARYLLGGSSYMTGSSNSFVVKPYGFAVSDIKRTADGFANPAAADAAGPAFIKAGASFSATVSALAYNASGNTTAPNYGREIVREGVLLTSSLAAGLGLANNPALANATIAGSEFGSGGMVGSDANGVATVTNLAWNEVGIITLTPSVADGDYLGAGNVTGAASANVGRFHPDHFALSAGTIANRTDISPACSPASAFTYMGEPFQAGFTLTAKGPAPGNLTLQNYANGGTLASNFAKLATGAPIPAGFGMALLDGSTDLSSRLDSSLGIGGSWTAGVLNATATLGLVRGSAPDGPYDAMKVGIAPTDADGVTLSAYDMDVTAPAGNDHAAVGETQIRFGRLRLGNAHGSELLDLPLPLSVQYWNGSQFATHAADNCTRLNSSSIGLGNYTGSLASGETSASPATISFAAGVGALTLTRPGSGNSGSVDVCVDLGSDPAGGTTCSAASASMSYLQGKWAPGTNWDNDPRARATFGVYKNANEFIYLREMY